MKEIHERNGHHQNGKPLVELPQIKPLRESGEGWYPVAEDIRDGVRKKLQNEVFCRAVTWVLKVDTPPELIDWFKQNGMFADLIANEKANDGTIGHRACDKLDCGEELRKRDYKSNVWRGLWGYTNFVRNEAHQILAMESTVFDTQDRVAGTLDRLIERDDGLEVLDLKFTSGIYDSHIIQVQTYAHLCNVMGLPVKNASVLRLGSRHKQAYEYKRMPYDPSVYEGDFLARLHIHERRYPYQGPRQDGLPEKLKLD